MSLDQIYCSILILMETKLFISFNIRNQTRNDSILIIEIQSIYPHRDPSQTQDSLHLLAQM
jgi:hypothetical protein